MGLFPIHMFVLFYLNTCFGFPQLSGDTRKQNTSSIDIPDGFLFGAGTSAIQVEGASKTDGRTESFMEWAMAGSHVNATPEIACDSFHRYKEDVKVIEYIGLNLYRFSMSWSRLLPQAHTGYVNQKGVRYYHALLDELERAGVQPMVQLVHFDHPAVIENFGGWQNETTIELFKEYARFVFQQFGHRVKYFLTFNEPNIFCQALDSGYLFDLKNRNTKPTHDLRTFTCSTNLLKAHAEVYHLYHDQFNRDKKGRISLNIMCNDYFPRNKTDQVSADVAFAFGCGWFADPIFSKSGDYSDVLKQRVRETSELRGFTRSELPALSESWVKKIRGSADFFAMSYYSVRLVEAAPANDSKSWRNFYMPPEARLVITTDTNWTVTQNLNYLVPHGLNTMLNKIKEKYINPPVYIVENGLSDDGQLNDIDRIKFIYSHLKEVIYAITKDHCDVKAYIYWSLLDNFEFWAGYDSHFGLVHVDFNHPNRTRTLKQSATWLKDVIHKRQLYI